LKLGAQEEFKRRSNPTLPLVIFNGAVNKPSLDLEHSNDFSAQCRIVSFCFLPLSLIRGSLGD
jgi:hypothetical protein